jgi:hypothetical protein
MTDTIDAQQPTDTSSRIYERLADQANAHNKGAIFDALAEARIHTLTVEFDGYGDSGQIESIEAFDSASQPVELPDKRQLQLMSPKYEGLRLDPQDAGLHQAIEMLIYEYLEAAFMGWEDGEGSYGTFVFSVPERAVTLEHHQRFVDVDTSVHNF